MRGSRLLVVLILLSAVGCRSASPLPPPAAVRQPAPSPERADPDSVRWVRDSAEYRAAVLQAYRMAAAQVETAARGRSAGTWAVILDADETLISNVTYQVERARIGQPFSAESWRLWVQRREATPLPGATAFLAHVRRLGGRIAVVTNRMQAECDDTAAVFARHTLVYDAMLCRPEGSPSDKNPRFEAVAAGRTPASASPVDVIAFVGDNILDFPGLSQAVVKQGDAGVAAFGVRYFIIPNPMYGSWQ